MPPPLSIRGPRLGRIRWGRVLLLQLLLWPLLFLAVEVGLRAMRKEPWSAERVDALIQEALDANRRFVPRANADLPFNPAINQNDVRVLHPYCGYTIVGLLEMLGTDLREQRRMKPQEQFSILIVGGSVSQIFGLYGLTRFRQRLHELADFGGAELWIQSYGVGGYREPQLAQFLAWLFSLGLDIDAVIAFNGFNEVAIGNQNMLFGTSPAYPSVPHWAQLALGGSEEPAALALADKLRSAQRRFDRHAEWWLGSPLLESCALGTLSMHWLDHLRSRSADALMDFGMFERSPDERRLLRGPTQPEHGAAAIAESVRIWKECTRTESDLCRDRGIQFMQVLQPTLHDTGSKPLTAEEITQGEAIPSWVQGVQEGYPAMRQSLSELAAEGIATWDGSRVFQDVTEKLYFDACHFDARGCEIFADALAVEFVRQRAESGR